MKSQQTQTPTNKNKNSTSSLVSSVHKSRQIIVDLMKRQNYNVSDYENFSINEVNSMLQNNQLDMLLEKEQPNEVTNRKRKIYISYYLAKLIKKQNVEEIIDDLFNLEQILTKEDTLFIIIKEDMNETLTNEIKHIWEKDGIFIVIQNINRLQFNILEHILVPPHRVLSNNEINDVMLKYNIKERRQFPKISRFDPVAQVIGLRPGDICEITRSSKTSIKTFYYRVCI
jgi:DNA-directed RNA polymerase subunit H (RpoH/RPB5)